MKTLKTNLVLLAVTTLVVAACSSSNDPKPMTPPADVNFRPTIAEVADQSVDQDTVLGPIQFEIADKESDPATLKVEATVVDGTSVFPADGLVLSGTGATRTITLTPFEAATGSATIGLAVTDGEGSMATRAFKVTVIARTVSIKSVALNTFAKAEDDDPTPVNGFTFTQDADNESTFEALIPPEAP
ncbi:MAG: hypothetical protein ABI821_03800 [Pseudomonadota bacterium]